MKASVFWWLCSFFERWRMGAPVFLWCRWWSLRLLVGAELRGALLFEVEKENISSVFQKSVPWGQWVPVCQWRRGGEGERRGRKIGCPLRGSEGNCLSIYSEESVFLASQEGDCVHSLPTSLQFTQTSGFASYWGEKPESDKDCWFSWLYWPLWGTESAACILPLSLFPVYITLVFWVWVLVKATVFSQGF